MPKRMEEDYIWDKISQFPVPGLQLRAKVLEALFDLKRSDDLVEKRSRLLGLEEMGTTGL